MKKYILFGAGLYSSTTIQFLGKDQIFCILDNDSMKWGLYIDGIPIYSPKSSKDFLNDYQVIVSVSQKYQQQIIQQLQQMNVEKVKTTQEIQIEIIKKKMEDRTDYLKIYENALLWIHNNSTTITNGNAIICNSNKREGYPEVTGYFIPTLLNWGYRNLALSYAKWLCSIQKSDGAWCDMDNRNPYIFDTAQILKGLLSIKDIYPRVIPHIIKGCDWILNNMVESGRLLTPVITAWGDKRICSELVHLYCLSPLVQAADLFHMPQYKEAAYKILNYYKSHHYEEIMNFRILSHFYAYVMEALLDMGEWEMASEAMKKVGKLQKENGAVPAYPNVDWVCSTGLFQFALVWFRLGDMEKGNKAFTYACKLQNESGGWYGSYLSEENPYEENDYFPTSEISWAVKYFLDALYYKIHAEFNLCADSFLTKIEKKDGRYQIIKRLISAEYISSQAGLTILDAGCGKGRYLKNLAEDEPENTYYAVDLSETVMKYIDIESIQKKQGTLTNIAYHDNFFDITYTCEALEHAIDIKSAIRELTRVTKPGGKIVIIDKNKSELGRLKIGEWETWFDADELKTLLSDHCSEVNVIDSIDINSTDIEEKREDHLFLAWIGTVNKETQL